MEVKVKEDGRQCGVFKHLVILTSCPKPGQRVVTPVMAFLLRDRTSEGVKFQAEEAAIQGWEEGTELAFHRCSQEPVC